MDTPDRGLFRAIETRYNGYRFRSRLEARWAVFFDALGVRYEYEPEGLIIDGTPYLPDFWMPEWDMWAEIKPKQAQDDHTLPFALMQRLSEVSGKGVLLLAGGPWEVSPILFPSRTVYSEFGECASCRRLFLLDNVERLIEPLEPARRCAAGDCLYQNRDQVWAAVARAKEARFEHGEQP